MEIEMEDCHEEVRHPPKHSESENEETSFSRHRAERSLPYRQLYRMMTREKDNVKIHVQKPPFHMQGGDSSTPERHHHSKWSQNLDMKLQTVHQGAAVMRTYARHLREGPIETSTGVLKAVHMLPTITPSVTAQSPEGPPETSRTISDPFSSFTQDLDNKRILRYRFSEDCLANWEDCLAVVIGFTQGYVYVSKTRAEARLSSCYSVQ